MNVIASLFTRRPCADRALSGINSALRELDRVVDYREAAATATSNQIVTLQSIADDHIAERDRALKIQSGFLKLARGEF